MDLNGKWVNEEDPDHFVEDPNELVAKQEHCHFVVEIKEVVFYDITVLLNKRFNIQITLQTSEGSWDYLSHIFVVKDNKIQVEFSQFVNIENLDLNLIDFYLNKSI